MFKNNKIRMGFLLIWITAMIGMLLQSNAYALDYHDFLNKGQMFYDQGDYAKAQIEFEKARDALRQQGNFIRSETKSENSEQELTKLQEENKNLTGKLRELEAKKALLEKNLEKITKKLKQKDKPTASYTTRIKKLENAVIERQNQLKAIQEHVGSINKEKGDLSRELAALKEELIKLYQRKGGVETPKADSNLLRNKLSKFKDILGGKKQNEEKPILSIGDKLEHYEMLKEENVSLNAMLVQQKKQRDEIELNNKEIMKELEVSQDSLKQRVNEKEAIAQEVALLEKINNSLSQQKDSLEYAKSDSMTTAKKDKNRGAIKQREKVNKGLKAKIKEADKKYGLLKKEKKKLAEKVDELESNLTKAQAEA
ncbi:MAG: hypothetical protein KAS13_01640, partial [Candidatus Omnitrophica bacterium]|nr:hypothetical protein [Candidatus Omnitrophota bacterium]